MAEFSWATPLGVSVALFLATAGFYVVIGIGTFIFTVIIPERLGETFLFTARTDSILMGRPTAEAAQDDGLLRYREAVFLILGGFLIALGIGQGAIAWMGLRSGAGWALGVLALQGVVLVGFWTLLFRVYVRAGVTPGLGDTPPFMWIPAVLLAPATVLGWIGVSGSA